MLAKNLHTIRTCTSTKIWKNFKQLIQNEASKPPKAIKSNNTPMKDRTKKGNRKI